MRPGHQQEWLSLGRGGASQPSLRSVVAKQETIQGGGWDRLMKHLDIRHKSTRQCIQNPRTRQIKQCSRPHAVIVLRVTS